MIQQLVTNEVGRSLSSEEVSTKKELEDNALGTQIQITRLNEELASCKNNIASLRSLHEAKVAARDALEAHCPAATRPAASTTAAGVRQPEVTSSLDAAAEAPPASNTPATELAPALIPKAGFTDEAYPNFEAFNMQFVKRGEAPARVKECPESVARRQEQWAALKKNGMTPIIIDGTEYPPANFANVGVKLMQRRRRGEDSKDHKHHGIHRRPTGAETKPREKVMGTWIVTKLFESPNATMECGKQCADDAKKPGGGDVNRRRRGTSAPPGFSPLRTKFGTTRNVRDSKTWAGPAGTPTPLECGCRDSAWWNRAPLGQHALNVWGDKNTQIILRSTYQGILWSRFGDVNRDYEDVTPLLTTHGPVVPIIKQVVFVLNTFGAFLCPDERDDAPLSARYHFPPAVALDRIGIDNSAGCCVEALGMGCTTMSYFDEPDFLKKADEIFYTREGSTANFTDLEKRLWRRAWGPNKKNPDPPSKPPFLSWKWDPRVSEALDVNRYWVKMDTDCKGSNVASKGYATPGLCGIGWCGDGRLTPSPVLGGPHRKFGRVSVRAFWMLCRVFLTISCVRACGYDS